MLSRSGKNCAGVAVAPPRRRVDIHASVCGIQGPRACPELVGRDETRSAIALRAADPPTIIPPTMERTRHRRDFGVLFAALILAALHPLDTTAESQNDYVDARLVADVESIRPGTPFWIGVHLDIKPGWHVNWINPGDAGLAPSIGWALPDGFVATEILWPFPRSYTIGPIVIYGYDASLLLIARVTPSADLEASGNVEIGADVHWLACAETCVPGSAEVSLSLPVRSSSPEPDEKWSTKFEAVRVGTPRPAAQWRVQAFVEDEERYVLEVRSNSPDVVEIYECTFFPREPDAIEHASRQIFTSRHGGFDLFLKRSSASLEIPGRISGVLVAAPGWNAAGERRAITFDVPLEPR